MEIKKSQLRGLIREQLTAFFVTPEPFATVGRTKDLDDAIKHPDEEKEINKEELKDVIRQVVADVEKASTNRMKSGVGSELNANGTIAEAKGAAKWYEAVKRPVKVGDRVHVGHRQKGGAGIEGIVTKIEGDKVHIKDPNPKSRRTWYGALKNTAIIEISGVDSLKPNDPHTPEDEAEKDAADDVMEADPKKDGGRPRGAPRIDNERFWDLPERNLRFIIKDASEAIAANPMSRKASGKWADEVNDAVTVLHFRRKKGIKVDEAKEVGSLASNPQSKALIKKMHALVTKQLKLKSIEDIQPLKDGVGFIFGDKKEAAVLANYLKKAGVLGKSIPLAAGDGNRTLVSLKLK